MMNNETYEQIALHRYAVIAEALPARLTGAERGDIVRRIAGRGHVHPDGTDRRYSRATIDEIVPGLVGVEGWWSPSWRCRDGIVWRSSKTLLERDHLMKKLDRPAVRLVDSVDERLTDLLPADLAIELGGIARLCREGLMAVAVEAGMATAMAMMRTETDSLCGTWNARDPERTHVRGGLHRRRW